MLYDALVFIKIEYNNYISSKTESVIVDLFIQINKFVVTK